MDSYLLLKTWVKILVKKISRNLSGKYCKKRLDHAKQSATDALKNASKWAIQKTAKAKGDLIGSKIANAVAKSPDGRITKVSKTSQ